MDKDLERQSGIFGTFSERVLFLSHHHFFDKESQLMSESSLKDNIYSEGKTMPL